MVLYKHLSWIVFVANYSFLLDGERNVVCSPQRGSILQSNLLYTVLTVTRSTLKQHDGTFVL